MAQIQSGWMTTFFYEQDLKSEYMNGLLLSDLAPGVYNSSSSIYVVKDDSGSQKSGVYLYLNKGTTLIFSNAYKDDGNIIQRDLTAVGTYIIKCVLLEDKRVQLINTDTINNPLRYLLGYKNEGEGEDFDPANNFFVTALMKYDGSANTDIQIPSFKCCIRNNPTTTSNSRLYTTYSDGESSLVIQDKYVNSSATYDKTISYLHLGVVKAVDYDKTKRYAYNNGFCWGTGKTWLEDYTFIGRGLEEYRRGLTDNQKVITPDFVLDGKSKIYLDFNDSLIDGTLFNKSNNLPKIYSGESSPVADYEVSTDELPQGLPEGAKSDERAFAATMLFIASNNRISKSYNSEEPEEYKKDIQSIFTKNYEDINIKVLDYQWCGLSDYTYTIDKVQYGFTEYIHTPEANLDNSYIKSMSDTNTPITNRVLPLDIGLINENRIKQVLLNKNMLSEIIDNMRIEEKYSVQDYISLIPIALILREFKYDSTNNKWKNVLPTENEHKCYYDNNNIISYLDLQYKMSKVNSIYSINRDIYTVLPVIK